MILVCNQSKSNCIKAFNQPNSHNNQNGGTMKKYLIAALAVLFSCPLQADEPAQVMLIGTFHFDNPGKDVVKVDDFDIFTDDSQAYLQAFTRRLAAFKPTRVLLEYDPENEALINQRYEDYLQGNYELGGNEIYQLGFRIAQQAGLPAVQSFDEREVHWQAEALFEYVKLHDVPEMKRFNEMISDNTREDKAARAGLDLSGLLKLANDPVEDRKNMNLYLATNPIGVRDGFAGADATASWWRRNFRMYANIQKAARPGERVIVIGGQGHTAILKTFLEIDSQLEGIPVAGYF